MNNHSKKLWLITVIHFDFFVLQGRLDTIIVIYCHLPVLMLHISSINLLYFNMSHSNKQKTEKNNNFYSIFHLICNGM